MALWEPDEKVVCQASVDCNAQPGKLYLTNHRLGWAPQGASQLTIALAHANIKTQMVSKAGGKKIMLKVLAHQPVGKDGSFTFVFPPSSSALTDRDQFVDTITDIIRRQRPQENGTNSVTTSPATNATGSLLSARPATSTDPSKRTPITKSVASPRSQTPVAAVLLPHSLSSGPSISCPIPLTKQEIAVRRAVLSNNPELAKLHRDLVQSGYVHEEEFWTTRRHLLDNERAVLDQQRGQSSSWPDLVPAAQDGQNFTYSLTREKMYSIFQHHPRVQQAYKEHVPHNLSEEAFWKRFLASKLFHRDRAATSHGITQDEIFDKCLEEEEKEAADSLARRLELGGLHRFLDISRTLDDHMETGNKPDIAMTAGKVGESRFLIKSFNRHSETVLRAHLEGAQPAMGPHDMTRELVIEDLEAPAAPNPMALQIANQQRYLESQGQTVGSDRDREEGGDSSGLSTKPIYQVDPTATLQTFVQHFDQANFTLYANREPTSQTAATVLDDMFHLIDQQASILAAQGQQDLPIPVSLKHAVASCQVSGHEMLRHLWASLSVPVTDEKFQRATKIMDAIAAVKDNIRGVVSKAHRESSAEIQHVVDTVLKPLQTAINAGTAEFEQAKAKRCGT
ncbi:RNA polymerase II transcription factor B subunit 1 [Dimargaris xerosporica]|nr:RNA polymerase II transcription factor B subunit 1 [Dimargaris xerosporica]